MPIYEYVCQECGKKSSFLILKISEPFTGKCEKCGSPKLRRVLSRFAAVRSEESRMERLADPSRWGDFDENDPKSMARFMKKMGQEMGEDLGDDFDQIVEESEEEASSAPSTDEDDL